MPTFGPLRKWQSQSVERMLYERSHFLFYQMGLGKTPTAVTAGYSVGIADWLILCPKNAIRTWEDHIIEWFRGLDATFEKTNPTPYAIHRWRGKYNDTNKRRALWNTYIPDTINIYIMTYAGFVADHAHIGFRPNIVILDECRRIRNRKSAAFEHLKPIIRNAQYFWPMTGTPGKLPMDIWTLFHLAKPKYWRSYWKFVSMFHYVMKNEWGRQEILGLRNEDQWFRTLKSQASIVSKSMVAADIGNSFEPQRQLLHVELDEIQQRLYNQMLNDMMMESNDTLILAKTSLDRTLKLRQLLACPKILDPAIESYGAAIEDLADTLNDTSPHVVIFSFFVEAIPFIKARLEQCGLPPAEVLHGGLSPDEVMDRINRFRTNKCPIICSTMFAESFSLEPASECFFIGYSYNPEDNIQAEFRIQRLTTQYPTNAYYYAYANTYDEEQAQIVCIKHQHAQQTFNIQKAGLNF